jgi:hypothetical protein
MIYNEIEKDSELQGVLWACYHYCSTAPPSGQRWEICYSWVLRQYKNRFGRQFHQSRLRRLSKLGFLSAQDTSRGGRRRYYNLVDPDRIAILLKKWNLLDDC